MAKIKRKTVTIDSTYYNFDQRYEEVMAQFDDVIVINVHVISIKTGMDTHQEKYLVFFQEREDEEPDED